MIESDKSSTDFDRNDVFNLTPENLILLSVENHKKVVNSKDHIDITKNIVSEVINPKNQDIKDERETLVGFFRRLCLNYIRLECKWATEQKIKTHYPWLKFSIRRVFGSED